jgi:hypothetical protein
MSIKREPMAQFSLLGRFEHTVACALSLLMDISLPHHPHGMRTGGRPPGCLSLRGIEHLRVDGLDVSNTSGLEF